MIKCKNEIFGSFKDDDYKYVFATRRYGLNENDLRDIDISTVENKGTYTEFKSNFLDNKFSVFKAHTTEPTEEGVEYKTGGLKLISDDTDVKYIIKDKIAQIKSIRTIEDIYKNIHEIGHLVLNYSTEKDLRTNVYREINNIANFIKNMNGLDIEISLTDPTGNKITKNFSELNELGKTDNPFEDEEILNSFVTTLIANDFIKSNNKILAKIFNKDKSIGSIDGNYASFRIVGSKNETRLTTISQFYEILREYGYSNNDIYTKKMTENIYSIINTSPEMKEAFFNAKGEKKSKASDFDLIGKLDKKMSVLKNGTYKLHRNFFDGVGIADLLDLSKSKMMLNKALALAKGGMNKALEYAKENKDFMESAIEKISPDLDKDLVDNIIGHMTVFGFNFLNNDLVGLSDKVLSIFEPLKSLTTEKLTETFEMYPGEAKESLDKVYTKIISDIEMRYNEKVANNINSLIKKVSNGSKEDLDRLTKLISKMHNSDITEVEARNISRKLSSLYAIKERIGDNDYFSKTFRTFASIYRGSEDKVNEVLQIFNSKLNKYAIFGDNIELKFLEESKGLQITDEPTGIDKDNIIATFSVNGKDYYAFVGDKYNTSVGNQDALVLPFNISDFEKGIYEREIDGVNIKLNAQNMMLKNNFMDKKLSTQFKRNSYIEAKKEIAKDLGYKQWKILVDNNILLTKQEVNTMVNKFGHSKDRYIKLGKDNPLTQLSGGSEWYIDGRIAHQLMGTKGVDIKNIYSGFTNEQQAKTLALYTKSFFDLVREASKALLFVTPKILINNYLTSLGIYLAHTNGLGVSFVKYHRMAKKLYKNYKDDLKEYVSLQNELEGAKDDTMKETIQERLDEVQKRLEDNPLSYAFDNGFTDTLRTTALQINAVEDLTVYQLIKNKLGKHQSEIARFIFMNENNPLGKKMGDIFENGELFPKLALYLNKLDKTKDKEEALLHTLHAFPRYYNLPLSLQLIDYVSPYTKFFLNIPRLASFAFVNNPTKYLAMQSVSFMMPTMMDENQQDSWYKDNGFIDIGNMNGKNIYLSQTALDPILHPLSAWSFKPTIFDIPHWFLKDVANATGGIEGITQFMLPISIGK